MKLFQDPDSHLDYGSTGKQTQLEGAQCQFSVKHYLPETREVLLASSNLPQKRKKKKKKGGGIL